VQPSYLRLLFSAAVLLVLINVAHSQAQSASRFTGTWILDESRNGPAREIWFVNRAHKFVVNQVGSTLTIDADGSIADVPDQLSYNLDGSDITTINHSAGDIPGWIRKLRTNLTMQEASLVARTSHVSETGGHENVSVTIVLTFQLLSNDREMRVERTGFRPIPPESLHGRPYKQEDDFLYRKDSAIYVKAPQ
jgi:hypothetical protein